jgi:hypothetical protein
VALKQAEENYDIHRHRLESQRQIHADRRITAVGQHDALKELAGRIAKLSYTDMKRLVEIFEAKNVVRTTADRLIAVAEHILREGK